jgi:hypothetical protein
MLLAFIEALKMTPEKDSLKIDGIVHSITTRSGKPAPSSVDLESARQAVFAMVGSTTMLYSWSVPTRPNHFSISDAKSQGVHFMSQRSEDGSQRKIGNFLGSFGSDMFLVSKSFEQMTISDEMQGRSRVLFPSQLNYATISTVGRIQSIEFVDNISSHLKFDQYQRKLFMFAYPEYCAFRRDNCFDTEILER